MAAVSKEEYLKRYLSNSEPSVRRRRKKKVKTSVRSGKSLIIDDDVNLSDIKTPDNDDESQEKLLDIAEESPLIFDEAGATVLSNDLEVIRKKDEERKAMWAPVRNVSDDETERNSPKVQKSNISGHGYGRRQRHDSPSPERTTKNNKSPDLSPPRRKNSPKKLERHSKADFSGDQSPPRRQHRHDSSNNTPPRITSNNSGLSPSRKSQQNPSEHRTVKRRHDSPDLSPERKSFSRRDIDQSPPRKQGDLRGRVKEGSPDLSPLRETKHGTRNIVSSDLSPPRRNRNLGKRQSRVRNDTPDMSPRRMGSGRDATSLDLSPPRQTTNSTRERRVRNDTPDISPAQRVGNRRKSHSPDLSPPRRTTNSGSKGQTRVRNDTPHMSPPQKTTSHRLATSPDLSPLKRNREGQPVKKRIRHDTPDPSSFRQGKLRASVSPKKQRQKVTPDLSLEEPTKHGKQSKQ